jgi:lysophospholipase L1-like esterase
VRWLKSVLVSALVLVLGASGGLLAHARADGGHHAPRIFAVGHSWVVGTSSGRQIGYVDSLVRSAGVQRVDADHPGDTARQVEKLVAAAPRCRPNDLAILQVGLNDVRRFGDGGLPRFRTALSKILSQLSGCSVILVQEPGALDYTVIGHRLLGSDGVVRDYRQATADIAAGHRNVTLVRPRLGTHDYLADGLHPDRSGNRRIAAAIRTTATWQAFARTG